MMKFTVYTVVTLNTGIVGPGQISFLLCFIISCIVTGVAINRLPSEGILPYVIQIWMTSELIVQLKKPEGPEEVEEGKVVFTIRVLLQN